MSDALTLSAPAAPGAPEDDVVARGRRVLRLEIEALAEVERRLDGDFARAVELIRGSQRPLIVAGGGVIYSAATEELRAFAERTGIPVAETQAGKGALPHAPTALRGPEAKRGRLALRRPPPPRGGPGTGS